MGVYTHINLNDQSSAIERLPAPQTIKINGKSKVTKTTISGLGQKDAMWVELPEDIKANILRLAGAAKK
jgi:hypothetical protein